ncbi:lytic transglycosylase domain-containing protein [Arenimonas fontis]|uniref:Lytic transglycosylase domain-containing protein n=1 Tax=Arenimonas fontis TaxID=2608255 RepID=A0A5B2ZCF9_9GAMM|nr:lytic transglycosylase domain-containing protein [Arenimonas fontis]KAA2284812.1 lytic transglycosylase domain-containing protein [Arenimonas fontis]
MSPRLPLLACLLFAAAPAEAGTLYRCTGADGIPNYTSKKVPGASCKVVANYGPADARPRAPAPGPTPPAGSRGGEAGLQSRVEFRTAGPGQAPAAAPAPAAGARVTRGAVYRYERDGVVHYTNVRPPGGSAATLLFTYVETCYACGLLPGVDFHTVRLDTESYAAEVRAAAGEFGVEEAVVRAIIHAESAYRPDAVSHAGAQGLMQLIPATAERFGVRDVFDPAQNIRGGVQYLAWLLKRYDGDLSLAAAGYNAGEGAVDRYGGIPPYAETRRYVERVGILAERYRGALAAN